MKLRDLTGQRFNRLTAVRQVENAPGYGQARWLFRCDCGNEITIFGYNAAHGRQKSCGCYKTDHPPRLRHGCSDTPTFHSWASMRGRCMNPRNRVYADYGGRGIKVCPEWDSFERFLADMGEQPLGMTLDRKNNNGPYAPENCRWATRTEQVRNRRVSVIYNFQGEALNIADWADRFGLPYKTIWNRYVIRGWRGDKLFSPLRYMTPRNKAVERTMCEGGT